MILKNDHFALSNFEGTLDFLLCLIQKEEIDIYDIPIHELMHQFIAKLTEWEKGQLDRGAEFIGTASYLVLLKSKMLIPHDTLPLELEEGMEDPHFEIIHHLIDYCRFKQVGKELASRQEKEQDIYYRGIDLPEWQKPMGIDHLSLDDLCQLFKEMLRRAPQAGIPIEEENWRVCDKIKFLRSKLCVHSSLLLNEIFSSHYSRPELIVTFLALLELMKMGEVRIDREQPSGTIFIYSQSEEACL